MKHIKTKKIMKYLVAAGAMALAMMFTACNKEVTEKVQENEQIEQSTLYRSVSAEEYSSCDVDTRRLIDLIDGAANALVAMRQNGADRGFEAMVSYSISSEDVLTNTVIVSIPSPEEEALMLKTRGEAGKETCDICGVSSGYSCYKKIREKMKEQKVDEIDIRLKLKGERCVTLIY